MNMETGYEAALERMEEQMRHAAVWRTQRAAMDARRQRRRNQRTGGAHGEQNSRGLLATLTQAFSARSRNKRDDIAATAQQRTA